MNFDLRMSPEDIICISTSAWNFLLTRKQRLMARFAKQGHRVLYVDPCYANRSERLWPANGLRLAYDSHVRQVADNLWVMQPPFPIPLGRFGWSRTLSNARMAGGIKQFLDTHEFRFPVLWIYPPTAMGLVDRIPHRLLIYEVVDEYAEYPTYGEGMKKYIRECEQKMLQRADLVFVTSSELLKGRAEISPNICVSPNGVDVELFSRTQDPSMEVPEDIRDLPRPILGFVGGIAPWTDIAMVSQIAARRPMWSVVLIGPVDPGLDLSRFEGVGNVHFLGRRNPESLPAYLKGMDICLNLFKMIPLTRGINPLKVYEYLAAGKPVVSTPMPEVDKFRDLVQIAKDPEGFVAAVEEALSERDDPWRIKARMEAVAAFSWDHIFDGVTNRMIDLQRQIAERLSHGGGHAISG